MDYALFVQIVQGLNKLPRYVADCLFGQSAILFQNLVKIALCELGYHAEFALCLEVIVHLHHIFMIQLRKNCDLLS